MESSGALNRRYPFPALKSSISPRRSIFPWSFSHFICPRSFQSSISPGRFFFFRISKFLHLRWCSCRPSITGMVPCPTISLAPPQPLYPRPSDDHHLPFLNRQSPRGFLSYLTPHAPPVAVFQRFTHPVLFRPLTLPPRGSLTGAIKAPGSLLLYPCPTAFFSICTFRNQVRLSLFLEYWRSMMNLPGDRRQSPGSLSQKHDWFCGWLLNFRRPCDWSLNRR